MPSSSAAFVDIVTCFCDGNCSLLISVMVNPNTVDIYARQGEITGSDQTRVREHLSHLFHLL